MDLILLFSRLLLAVVFLVAGFAKLADLSGSRKAVRDFGVPGTLADPLGTLLPFGEIIIGLALLPIASTWWGAIGAFALLLVYMVAISYNLARGRKPNCHCFGALYSAPAGWSTLIRNGVLAALAGLIILPGPNHPYLSAVHWLSFLRPIEIMGIISTVLILAVLSVEGWFVFYLLQQNGRLLARMETLEKILNAPGIPRGNSQEAANPGLPIGTPAPVFQLSGLYGETLTLDALRNMGKPLLLMFLAPDCGPCNALLPEIGHWQNDYISKVTIALISEGTVDANRSKTSEHKLTNVLLQNGREVAEKYFAYGTPSAILVRPDGTVGSVLAAGADAIRNLVAYLTQNPAPSAQPPVALLPMAGERGNGNNHAPVSVLPASIKIGEPAPAVKLPNLSGQTVDLAEFHGDKTLVMFWSPHCGFCDRMLGDLRGWEANPPKDAPQLLFISSGTVEENKAMGLKSPILLDQGFAAGRAFGASGTPTAILLDAQGRIASEVAVGAPAVLALTGAKTAP
jgi:peroxiredoxin/uncharacterized membrane protein YphA (DoxX/SURF4 family)